MDTEREKEITYENLQTEYSLGLAYKADDFALQNVVFAKLIKNLMQ